MRFAYKATPVTLCMKIGDEFQKTYGYSVDFEIACDLYDILDARGSGCIYNPHLVNIAEPGTTDTDAMNTYISHSIIIDEASYRRLYSVSNTENLRSYTGVVNGYSINKIRAKLSDKQISDTVLCLTELISKSGGLVKPDIPFNENKHRRYVQASESHRLKMQKQKTEIFSADVYYELPLYRNKRDDMYAYK